MKKGNVAKLSGKIIPLALGIILPCFFYFYVFHKDNPKPLPQAVEISNQLLPISKLVEVEEGTDFSAKIRNGKVMLIFLSSNCGACKKDIETLSKIDLSQDIQIYGLTIEKKEKILKTIKENDIKFPILLDVNSDLFNKLKIRYFPTKFLLEDGIIKKTLFGNFADESSVFKDLQIVNISK